ncbi:aminotransferase class III-fold pyridoxal phosphate-dependent enzyme [Saccharopolyspora sp. TS4A08]|uniref:Aminotransferase class III-fold pyridoxal phosphate-dependent enzyme n=1 Tax=Saccharopolyspora ipomoeae TaxID=3042027 RepID=A0ABT6PPG8_9PSEU|nr:aminotransferase class III-fold pyridoxal phosphate-dependent enzyme [Saccharopolyspora sp. TS4A08]MDI2029558.1 aminotransferase class III-fold pyridoxal phosphate-dependent enzyme [Saccharopolyspora sp. TS4A08]
MSIPDRAQRVLPGGNTRTTLFVPPHPPYAVRGNGALITDDTGHRVIDCNNNYTSLIHGHARAEVLETAIEAARSGTAFGLPTASEVALAEHLRDRTGIEQWRFCNSGSEAVLMLLRAARAYTGRDLIIRFDGSYHGTGDALVPPEAPGLAKSVSESVLVLPQNDLAAVEKALHEHGARVAAVLIDLMPNRAGLIPADPEYVTALRNLTRQHATLLAVDEVITFRLREGGLHTDYDIQPDLVSVGKVIGGGFPVGAIGGSAEVLSPFAPTAPGAVSWGGTFSANPVTMAAGLTALQLFGATEITELNQRGDAVRARLLKADVPVRGSGSLLRLTTPNPTELWWKLYHAGVLAGTNGLLALSTAMTDAQLDQITDGVTRAFRT